MDDYLIHVPGRERGKVVLYALSTCLWCGKTKKLLAELGVEYYYADVDLLEGAPKEHARSQVIRWKNRAVYPCLVIDGEKCIPQYDEDAIRQLLAERKGDG